MIDYDSLIDNTLTNATQSSDTTTAGDSSPATTSSDSGAATASDSTTTDTTTTSGSDSDTTSTDNDSSDTGDASSTGGASSTDDSPSTTSDSTPIVPASIAGTSQATELKPRYQGDSEFGQMVAEDWMEVIKADPRSFQALLFRPSNGTFGVVDEETGLEAASFTDLDNNQRDLTYEDPVIVTLRDSNDSREMFENLDDDTAQNGLVDDFLVVSIADRDIPKGSILEWNEEQLDGSEKRVWWYVNQIFSYGTQHVGTLYYCIPARTFDTTAGGKPK